MTAIYKIINHVNQKLYIGKTINPDERWKRHLCQARNGFEKHLYNAIRKYGENQFSMEIIEWTEDDKANSREIYWIAYYDTTDKEKGYNKTTGGEGGNTWDLNEHKEESSAKMSKSQKGHPPYPRAIEAAHRRRGCHFPDEAKVKVSQSLKEGYASGRIKIQVPPHYDRTGQHHTEEAKRKLSQSRKNKTYEEIYKDKADEMKEQARQRWIGDKNPRYKNVSVDQIVELIKRGLSNQDIALQLHISPQTIWERLKSIGTTATELRKEAINENNI